MLTSGLCSFSDASTASRVGVLWKITPPNRGNPVKVGNSTNFDVWLSVVQGWCYKFPWKFSSVKNKSKHVATIPKCWSKNINIELPADSSRITESSSFPQQKVKKGMWELKMIWPHPKKKKAGPMEKKPQVSPKSSIKPGTLMGVKANSWVVTPGCPATTQEAASFNSGAMAWRHDTNIACIITIYPPWNYSKSSHLKIGRAPKGNSYSKPSIFGGQKNVSFREGI